MRSYIDCMDLIGLRRFLVELQQQLENTQLPSSEKLRALHALTALASWANQGVEETPHAFAQVATLLEFSIQLPAARELLHYFPVLTKHEEDRPATGWGAL